VCPSNKYERVRVSQTTGMTSKRKRMMQVKISRGIWTTQKWRNIWIRRKRRRRTGRRQW
jgi:hypothetical protein